MKKKNKKKIKKREKNEKEKRDGTCPFLHPQSIAIPECPVQSAGASSRFDGSVQFYDSSFHLAVLALLASAGLTSARGHVCPVCHFSSFVVQAPAQHVDAETCKEYDAAKQALDATAPEQSGMC